MGPEVPCPALMAPPECDSESEQQNHFVVSQQNHQTTFSVVIFFLEISAWPGGFFSTWKGLKGSEVVGCILAALLTHPLGRCRQILGCEPQTPSPATFLNPRISFRSAVVKAQPEAAVPQRAAPKVWREKEKPTPASSRKKVDFVL